MERLAALAGIAFLLAAAWLLSSSRRAIPWRLVAIALAMQVVLALLIVRAAWAPWVTAALAAGAAAAAVRERSWLFACGALGVLAGLAFAGVVPRDFTFAALDAAGDAFAWLTGFAKVGADWVFGGLERGPFVFAIDVGAIILCFSAGMAVLHHVGFLPWLVGLLGRLLRRSLGVSGAESLVTAANVFAGQTEAPLVVRPYLPRLTRSETMALMTGGFATIAGSVLGVYMEFLRSSGLQRGAADLIAASVMSAPAAILFAKMMVPESEVPETLGGAHADPGERATGLLDALAGGVGAGLRLAVNVVAMLLVFSAMIQLLDASVNGVAGWFGSRLTFQDLYAHAFSPFAFLMGVPEQDCVAVGRLLGTKTIFNEFLAYEQLGGLVADGVIRSRSAVLSTYALCGFANFMSIGVQIGGLAALAPERRPMFAGLALRAMVAGTLACHLTACIVGVVGDL